MTDREPTDTTLAEIMGGDQAETLAGKIGAFYTRLMESGMKPRAAEALTATYGAMVVAQHFGVDVGESFAVGPLYGGED